MEPFGAFFGTKFTPYLEALRTHADKRYISVIIIIIIKRAKKRTQESKGQGNILVFHAWDIAMWLLHEKVGNVLEKYNVSVY